MGLWLIFCLLAVFVSEGDSAHVHNAVETEMFAIPISPNLFNWTYQGNVSPLFLYNIVFTNIII